MNTSKNNKFDRVLFIVVMLLTFLGYIMVVSAHAPVWSTFGVNTFIFEIAKTTVFIIIGFFLMTIIRKKFDRKKVLKLMRLILLIIIPMMIATLFFPEQNGAKAWIRIPFMSIQPVEFLKIVMILYFANHFGTTYQNKESALSNMKQPLIFLTIAVLFVFLLQKDLGSALILVIIALCIFMAIPEKKYKPYKLIIFITIIVTLVAFYTLGPSLAAKIYTLDDGFPMKNQLLRIAVLFDPLKEVYGPGFQVTNSLVALNKGGIFGLGLNESMTKYIIPEPYNDAIIAVIAEEFGLFGISVIFIIYFFIISRLLSYATKPQVEIYDRLILIGIASFFMAQFFVNIGGMVGLIPMTGVTLLFISSGGSSILTAFITIGIAQGVIKRYLK